ncbi:MAG TPA: medium chain dehydrogenase/reductase family protein [Polyangia bacterium]|jgi:NADPH2:quinone reductase|nr:medium chain dehydrogenase/reductase family protein [Polyangia bacterium]
MPSTRKVVITRRGGPEVLRLVEEELPEPAAGQVRVHVAATGVAFADVLMREGLYPTAPKPPFAPGYDIAGTVDKLGEGVTGVRPGQRVAALIMVGGYADHACVPADSLVPVPDGVDAAEAVALVLNFLTAYQMLHRSTRLRAGERILIHGAGGGVGDALLQLGKLAGLQMYGTASKEKHATLSAAGAVPIDYRSEDFVERIRALTGDGVDAVFDAVGGKHWARSFAALRVGGALVGYGFSSATRKGRRHLPQAISNYLGMPRFQLLRLMDATRAVMGFNVMVLKRARPEWYAEDLGALLGMLAERKLRPLIAERRPLAEAARAHQLLDDAAVTGKIVLQCGGAW